MVRFRMDGRIVKRIFSSVYAKETGTLLERLFSQPLNLEKILTGFVCPIQSTVFYNILCQ